MHKGDLILLQVKRTLTATTLDDAATEMAAIEAVAAARNPAVKPFTGSCANTPGSTSIGSVFRPLPQTGRS